MIDMHEHDVPEPDIFKLARHAGHARGVAQEHDRATLSNAYLRLDVEAGARGGIGQFGWTERGILTSVFRRADGSPLPSTDALSCQPLIRIQSAADDLLVENWRLDAVEENAVCLKAELADVYCASQTFTLDGSTLDITIGLANTGDTPLQCGIDIRTSFVRDPDTRISAPADGILIAERAGDHPRLVPTPPAWQFGVAYPLPATTLNHLFMGWGGQALVEWPARRFSLAIEGDTNCYRLDALPGGESFSFQLVHDPLGQRGGQGEDAHGLTVLDAGKTLVRRVSFTVERPGCPARTTRHATN